MPHGAKMLSGKGLGDLGGLSRLSSNQFFIREIRVNPCPTLLTAQVEIPVTITAEGF